MTMDQVIRYQEESVARAKLPVIWHHSKPAKTTQQKQTTGAAA